VPAGYPAGAAPGGAGPMAATPWSRAGANPPGRGRSALASWHRRTGRRPCAGRLRRGSAGRQDRRGAAAARERARRQVAVSRSWHRKRPLAGLRCRSAHNVFSAAAGAPKCSGGAAGDAPAQAGERALLVLPARRLAVRLPEPREPVRSGGSHILAELETVRVSPAAAAAVHDVVASFCRSHYSCPTKLGRYPTRPLTATRPPSRSRAGPGATTGQGIAELDDDLDGQPMRQSKTQRTRRALLAGRIVETPEQDRLIRWQQRHEGPLGHLVLHADAKAERHAPEAARHSLP